jgi:hypothetical protein
MKVRSQDRDPALLVELDSEVVEEVVSAEKTHQHWAKTGAQIHPLTGDRRWQGIVRLVVAADPSAGVDPSLPKGAQIEP